MNHKLHITEGFSWRLCFKSTYSVAIGLLLVSNLAFSIMSIFVRLAGDLPTMQKAFFRNLVSITVAVWMLNKSKAGFRVQARNVLPICIRAVSGTVALVAGYYTFDHMIIADATILFKSAPFFTMLFSAWLMKEKVRTLEWLIFSVAVFGSVLVIKPSFNFTAMLPAIIAILGGVCTGVSVTLVRFMQIRGEKSETIVLAFSAFSCFVFLPSLILNYVPMNFTQFAYLMGAGVAAAVGQFSMSAAYKRAPSNVLSSFEYSQVLFTAVLGAIMFAQLPDALSLVGYLIVVSASVLMAAHGNKKENLPSNNYTLNEEA